MNNQKNINSGISALKHFTQAVILQQIGSRRLAKFFGDFSDNLKAADIPFPDPDSENGNYFDALAAALAPVESLPERLRTALFTLEAAASPENEGRLEDAIQRLIPNVNLSGCPVDRALELWFLAPDELSQFQLKAAPVGPLPPAGVPKSSIEHPASVPDHQSTNPIIHQSSQLPHSLDVRSVQPWPEPVNSKLLLDALVQVLRLFVILPTWAAETLALWIVHTFAFQLRDVSTYIGIESPEKQCGKTTLLTVLSELANRAVTASNISPPAFFRVIEDLCPTLLIDEADTFLRGNEQLKGILNAGYKKKTAFVLRAAPVQSSAAEDSSLSSGGEGWGEEASFAGTRGNGFQHPASSIQNPAPSSLPHQSTTPSLQYSNTPSAVARFSCWCPKLISQIGRLPDTLADRCIVIRMQRKTRHEECERLRNLEAEPLKQQCARFVLDHQQQIATARPEFPSGLSDRASDIWEPLLVLADLAGGDWPQKARQAAVSLSAVAQETNPIGSLLTDIFLLFLITEQKRMFSRTMAEGLVTRFADRPWLELSRGKEINGQWLAQQLRPYGVKPRTIWIGEQQAKGYAEEDFQDIFRRYIPRSELEAFLAEAKKAPDPDTDTGKTANPPAANPSAR